MASQKVQEWIHKMEVGGGARVVWMITAAAAVLALVLFYDLRAYRNFSAPEAMDAAQVARNLSEGRGFTTDCIRPFSIYLVQKHNREKFPGGMPGTNKTDFAQLYAPHPDLANAPLYPLALAGLMKILKPEWQVEEHKPFWTEGGHFARYKPEFQIALFNQALMFLVVIATFFLAKKLFDRQVAWLSAIIMLCSDALWKFSVSGLSTMFLLLIFLGLIWCLLKIENLARQHLPPTRKIFLFALLAGLLMGAGILTRYSFGWLIVPVLVFLVLFGGQRRMGLAAAAFLSFALLVSPWIVRNLSVSGTFFGTAGYAVMEGTQPAFPGTRLLRSLNPDLSSIYSAGPYIRKLLENTRNIFQGDLLRLGGGWVAILFFAGLLIGLRSPAGRRLRYFMLMCLAVCVVVQALGQTQLSMATPEINSENLLVLFTPLAVIFGVVFFITMLDQMKIPTKGMRYLVIALVIFLMRRDFIWSAGPKISPISYPPYYPPDIQTVAGWMQPGELVMSDIPWAVAWYGRQQSVWTTLNSQYEFTALNDFIKPVNGLYLTLETLNQRLFTDCLQGGVDSWGNFVLKTITANQLPANFPLRNFPLESLGYGLFLADKPRW